MPQIKLCQMVFRTYVERQLIPYFAACGVHVEGSSGDALQRARLDDPRASPDEPRRRLEEHMGLHAP